MKYFILNTYFDEKKPCCSKFGKHVQTSTTADIFFHPLLETIRVRQTFKKLFPAKNRTKSLKTGQLSGKDAHSSFLIL